MMRSTVVAWLLVLGSIGNASAQLSVRDTKHNLSVSGPGTIRAASETRICIFCHTSHNGSTQGPAWNRQDPGGTFDVYWSPSVDAYISAAAAPQPNGSSKLCLSCHDGTIALGSTLSQGEISMASGLRRMPPTSRSHLGRDISGDHPVSFVVTDSLVANNNSSGDVPLKSVAEMRSNPNVRLDDRDRVQCISCHDPHQDLNGNFLLTAHVGDLCLGCHY